MQISTAWVAHEPASMAQATSGSWGGTVLAVFLAAAVVIALWRVVLCLLVIALVGLLMLGIVVLVADEPASLGQTGSSGQVGVSLIITNSGSLSC